MPLSVSPSRWNRVTSFSSNTATSPSSATVSALTFAAIDEGHVMTTALGTLDGHIYD